MNTFAPILQMMRADFLERVRRSSVLITLALLIYLAFLYIPPSDADYLTLNLGGIRGSYNAAWIGAMVALLASMILTLPGFYLVRGAVTRDYETGVGQILATTPISKPQYLLGKLLSNFALLAMMTGVLAVAATVMYLLRAEVLAFAPWQLLSPFLFSTLPTLFVIAALAVLWDSVPWLRGGFGNALYFLLWLPMLIINMNMVLPESAQVGNYVNDLYGVGPLIASITEGAAAAFPDYNGSFTLGRGELDGEVRTFIWPGVAWSAPILLGRLLWMAGATGLLLTATLWWDRFDGSYSSGLGGWFRKWRARHSDDSAAALPTHPSIEPTTEAAPPAPTTRLTPLATRDRGWRVGSLLLAEIKLLLKGQRWWWYVGAAGLTFATWSAALPEARTLALSLAWVWPLLLWSQLGARPLLHRTAPLLFSAPHPIRRQLPAAWLAGATVALLLGSGVGVRLLAAGEMQGVAMWLIGALFIPALALALGSWSGGHKLFEVGYLLLWYIGPMNRTAILDFTGGTPGSWQAGAPLIFAIATVALLGAAAVAQARQGR